MKVHDCPGCGQRVLMARTEARRWQLLEPLPDPNGTVAAYKDAAGTWHARTLTGDQKPAPPEHRYMPHAAACSKEVA